MSVLRPSLLLAVFFAMISSASPLAGQDGDKPEEGPMTAERLHAILEKVAKRGGDFEAKDNVARLLIQDLELLCIHDVEANRMRFLSPIKGVDELTEEEKNKMLAANYHSALDGRYCISNGVVYSAFIHPLDSLNERDVVSAAVQVLSLNMSFGDGYSSGVFQFGGEAGEGEEKKGGPLPNEA